MINIKRVDTKDETIRRMIDAIVPESHSNGTFMFVDLVNKNKDGSQANLVIVSGTILPVNPLFTDTTAIFDGFQIIASSELSGTDVGYGTDFQAIYEIITFAESEIKKLKSRQLDQDSSFDAKNADSSDCEIQQLSTKKLKREILVWEAFVTRLLQNKYFLN